MKTTGEIIPSIQMNPGIGPSNVALNTSLLCSHGMKAAARTDRGFACSSERASCAKKHKCFAQKQSILALGSATPSEGVASEAVPSSRVSCWVYVVLHRVGIMVPLCLGLHILHCGNLAMQSLKLSSKAEGADSARLHTARQDSRA